MHAQAAKFTETSRYPTGVLRGNLNTSAAKLIYASSNSKRATFLPRTAQKIAA